MKRKKSKRKDMPAEKNIVFYNSHIGSLANTGGTFY